MEPVQLTSPFKYYNMCFTFNIWHIFSVSDFLFSAYENSVWTHKHPPFNYQKKLPKKPQVTPCFSFNSPSRHFVSGPPYSSQLPSTRFEVSSESRGDRDAETWELDENLVETRDWWNRGELVRVRPICSTNSGSVGRGIDRGDRTERN